MNFEKPIKNLANINNKINAIIDYYKPKRKAEYDNKKIVVNILSKIKKSVFDFYVHRDTIFKLTKKYLSQRLDKVLSKHLKCSRSVSEIKDQYEKLSKYLKSQPEETIAGRVKLISQKKKKKKKIGKRNRNLNLNTKQTINQTSSIISTNKSLK